MLVVSGAMELARLKVSSGLMKKVLPAYSTPASAASAELMKKASQLVAGHRHAQHPRRLLTLPDGGKGVVQPGKSAPPD